MTNDQAQITPRQLIDAYDALLEQKDELLHWQIEQIRGKSRDGK